MIDNREQLEALLSRTADADLTADERSIIERAVTEDASAARASAAYERLDVALRGWRRLPGDVKWARLRGEISSAVRDAAAEQAAEFEAVDAAVSEWAQPMPEVDWSAFQARVSNAVRAEAAASGRGQVYQIPGFVRWLAPLGIAAVVGVALFKASGPMPSEFEVDDRPAAMVLVSLDVPQSAGGIKFAFDETPAEQTEAPPASGTAYVFSRPPVISIDDDAAF